MSGVSCDAARVWDEQPVGAFAIDLETGMFCLVNRKARRMLFGDASGDLDQPFSALWKESAAEVREILIRCAGSDVWQPVTLTRDTGDHAGVRFDLRGRGFPGAPGDPPRVAMISDEQRIPLFDEHRQLVRGLNQRLAEFQRVQTLLHEALDSEKRLRHELVHRTKNNVALLASLIRMKASAAEAPETRAALHELLGRTRAIALVHDLLDRENTIDVVEAADMIEELLRRLQQSLCRPGIRIERRLESHPLHVNDATPLCLLVNELVTNSLKHAFDGETDGEVVVRMRKNGVDKLEVHVADNGRGYVSDRNGAGSGSKIVNALAQQLRGELNVVSDTGTTWQLVFPPNGLDKAAE